MSRYLARAALGPLAALVACNAFWVACNAVLEDRSACPCLLSILVPDRPTRVFVDGMPLGEVWRDTCLTVRIPRADVSVTAVSGEAGGLPATPEGGAAAEELLPAAEELLPAAPDGSVAIPFGSGCPPLYLFQAVVDGRAETAVLEIRPRKAFCTLSLELGGPSGWESPYAVEIRGGVDGFTAGGEPHVGPFHCRLGGGLPSALSCRLPRQPSALPLWLDIVLPEGVVRSFPLGPVLEQGGYDWAAPELEDASLRLDLSVSGIRFSYGSDAAAESMEIVI